MKSFSFLFLFVAALGLAFTSPASDAVSYNVDTNSSYIKWTAYKVTGKHFGKIKVQTGSLAMNKGKLVGGSFVLDMTSLTVEDITGEYAEKLRGHLTSDDFFSVEKHKTAKFVIKKATATDKVGNYKVVGDLTIKGITKEITFDALAKEEAGKVNGTAKLKVDRTNYDIKYRSGKFFADLGDKAIYDDFDLEVTLVASK